MERSLKKGVTIFILCCALVAMLGACMTQRNNTVPENQKWYDAKTEYSIAGY